MSVVSIQLGQCGNQVGLELYNALMPTTLPSTSTSNAIDIKRFFYEHNNGGLRARAVLVDTEAKVITAVRKKAFHGGKWCYEGERHGHVSDGVKRNHGSGNNWACGYAWHGRSVRHEVMEALRKQVERCDHFDGFLLLMSLAGGTGSGVGSYITEAIRDDYPTACIVNQVMWPYLTGEVIVQNYNLLLTLSHLYRSADAVVVLENSKLHSVCEKMLAIKNTSIQDINSLAAQYIAGVLQPSFAAIPAYYGGHVTSGIVSPLNALVAHLCSNPKFKLLSLRGVPIMPPNNKSFSSWKWPSLLRHLRQMIIVDSPMEEGMDWTQNAIKINRVISNLLILRGKDWKHGLRGEGESYFADPTMYSSWSLDPFAVWGHHKPINSYEKSALLLSNSQSLVLPLDSALRNATQMYSTRAYLHQYARYGVDEGDFEQAFCTMEQVLADYKKTT